MPTSLLYTFNLDSPLFYFDRTDCLQAVWRSCAVMIDGLFINGPLLHYAYEALEAYMPAGESIISAVMQVRSLHDSRPRLQWYKTSKP